MAAPDLVIWWRYSDPPRVPTTVLHLIVSIV